MPRKAPLTLHRGAAVPAPAWQTLPAPAPRPAAPADAGHRRECAAPGEEAVADPHTRQVDDVGSPAPAATSASPGTARGSSQRWRSTSSCWATAARRRNPHRQPRDTVNSSPASVCGGCLFIHGLRPSIATPPRHCRQRRPASRPARLADIAQNRRWPAARRRRRRLSPGRCRSLDVFRASSALAPAARLGPACLLRRIAQKVPRPHSSSTPAMPRCRRPAATAAAPAPSATTKR